VQDRWRSNDVNCPLTDTRFIQAASTAHRLLADQRVAGVRDDNHGDPIAEFPWGWKLGHQKKAAA
jgi:hypothetical protein